MPTYSNMGYSEATHEKEGDFRYLIDMVMGKVKAFETRWGQKIPFTYIDMYSGSGFNYAIDCLGSPVIAKDLMEKNRMSLPRYHLVDLESKNTDHLKIIFGRSPESDAELPRNVRIYTDDCRNVVKKIRDSVSGYGILLIDPNGDPQFDVIRTFYESDQTSTIDVIIRVASTNYKRILSTRSHDENLKDCLSSIDKKYWYLKEPSKCAKRWTTIFGTNIGSKRMRPSQLKGFYAIHSPKGQAVLGRLTYTKSTPPDKYDTTQLPLDPFSGAVKA